LLYPLVFTRLIPGQKKIVLEAGVSDTNHTVKLFLLTLDTVNQNKWQVDSKKPPKSAFIITGLTAKSPTKPNFLYTKN
jgi:hypothetical protein